MIGESNYHYLTRHPMPTLAESERFELSELLHSTVFKTAALNHSANFPFGYSYHLHLPMEVILYPRLSYLFATNPMVTPYPPWCDGSHYRLIRLYGPNDRI